MRKNLHKSIAALITILVPGFASAQWGMVRFDEMNYFTKIETMTPDAALSFGLLSSSNSFVMRTNDGGTTWDSLDLVVSGNEYQIASMNFTDVQNGFAGGLSNGMQALIKTSDNGNSWTDISPDPSVAYQINAISFIDPQNGYAADELTVYRTLNGGTTWDDFTPGLSIKDIGFASMDVGYACGNISPLAAVMKTIDGGQTWTTVVTATLPWFFVSNMQKIDVVNQDVVFVSGQYSNKLFRSVDGGSNWDTITLTQISEIMDFDFTTDTYGQVVSAMGEIYSTNDGGVTWVLEYSVASGAYGPMVFLTSISFYGTTGYVCGSNGLIKKWETPTGIIETNSNGIASIYPVPASSDQTVYIGNYEGDFSVELFNSNGALLKHEWNTNEIYLNNISPGLYTVRVTTDKNVRFGKLIVKE